LADILKKQGAPKAQEQQEQKQQEQKQQEQKQQGLTTVAQDSMPVGQDRVVRTLTVVVGRFVPHMLFVCSAFDDTAFEGTSFDLHMTLVDTGFEGTSFEGTAHMLYMVVLRMPAAAAVAVAVAVASADQHMVAHIQ
jgi:hypothetical protein